MKKWIGLGLLVLVALLAACGGGGGVGSGGTGIPMSVSIGSVEGLGSVIVNGTRYETDNAELQIEDGDTLRLGMTARVTGTVSADHLTGTATLIVSAADLRGTVESLDTGAGTLRVLGTQVSIDEATVFAGVAGLADLRVGDWIQIYGLPGESGVLRATRIEIPAPAGPILTGTVEDLDTARRRFRIGTVRVDYADAQVRGGLAEGGSVRVRADALPADGVLKARRVEPWYDVPPPQETAFDLAGLVSDFVSPASFRLAGVPVDASGASVAGGPASRLGNGIRLEASGTWRNGVLVAQRVRIRHAPGTDSPASFSVTGTIGQFNSPSDFSVRGQRIDASGADFVNGTVQQLASGRRVEVTGDAVRNGVLQAREVRFLQ